MNNEITKEIREEIESKTGLDLSKKKRSREYVYTRAVYFKLCRENTELSLESIADTVGLNHATVIHSIKNVFPLIMKYDKQYATLYKRLKSPEPIEQIEEKYISLKEDYESLLSSTQVEDDAELIDIIKQIPESQIDVAKLRINAMVQMLKAH